MGDGGPIKLGLLTAPFRETPLSDVVDWTAASGFESIEISGEPELYDTDQVRRLLR